MTPEQIEMNKRLKPHLYKRNGKWTYEKAAPDTAWSELVRIATFILTGGAVLYKSRESMNWAAYLWLICGSGWFANQKKSRNLIGK